MLWYLAQRNWLTRCYPPMGDVLPFRKPAAKKQGLCQHGFHKWQVCKEQRFDVKQGRLVTVMRCQRCGVEKVEAR